MPKQTRGPKREVRKKSEDRMPKDVARCERLLPSSQLASAFEFRSSGFSFGRSRFVLVHDTSDHPTRGTFVIADDFASGQAIRGNHHPLMHAGAVRVNRDLRRAFGLTRSTDRLANDQPPPSEAWMLASGDNIAFDAG